jgi:beta-mannanase
MNGNWFPWSEGVNGNQAGQYVAAWRHVHDIFAAAGASNVTWVWCPNVDYNNNLQAITNDFPGSAYVDWTGLDGYNWGTNPTKPGGWKTFNQVYRSTYLHLVEKVAPSKPMMIGEVASSEYGGSKAAWIEDMLARVPTEYPGVRAMLWFDKYDSGMDWPIETSGATTAAFAKGIQGSAYLGNNFANLGSSAIPAPPG